MSDFDKEAEREKLREQLEEEEESRQHTQRMSELLLKGATMTNAHCDNCGDPIFRYDGQEFCPTCDTQQGGGDGQETAAASDPAAEQPAAEQRTAEGATDRQQGADGSPGAADSQPAAGEPSSAARTATPAASQSPPGDAGATSADAPTGGGTGGDVAAAADALRATLTKFSRKAAETDDPNRAREYLAAAREAAEALDALPY
ncbi:Sjogren's syndrome/scleroderma autoantigen 1 family protein [Halostella litorea]|uniref:Sjogren's syndrome/scleroderma autoantigen 1 family protein n=1 Tax=Halostella litorea TaxID=2528831 RepID=UPI00109249A7|nr:Sjogren's syndrome/scleroderma autoantigen 1 family protein [Halostella litorea]